MHTIKSFVKRGTFSKGQKRALTHFLPVYGLGLQQLSLTVAKFCENFEKTVLDIGFGRGDALLLAASTQPSTAFIGVEVHLPGVGYLLSRLDEYDLHNVKVITADIMQVLPLLPPDIIDYVSILFPDPWPKKRHHKRRLVQQPLLNALLPVLKSDGTIHIATDWQPYADDIKLLLDNHSHLERSNETIPRPQTKFEKRGLNLGHKINDFIYKRVCHQS